MDDRRKIVELLETHCDYAGRVDCREDCTQCLADHLIAHGVTVQKHGRWIWDENAIDWGLGGWVCSECQEKNDNLPAKPDINPSSWVGSRYCPNCGTQMDGEA